MSKGQDPNQAIVAAASPRQLPYTDPGMAGSAMAAPTPEGAPQFRPGIPIPQGGPQGAPPPQAGPPPQAALPPVPDTPTGIKSPVTNPQSPADAPRATQSPPDLANMYVELMRKNQNAQQLDSGLTLMAAGLSNSPATRAALISASGGGGHSGMSLSGADIVNMQKLQTEQQNQLVRQAAKAGLMKRYGLDAPTVDYLDSTGKLDDVISHKNTQNLVQVTHPDGTMTFNDPQSGQEVTKISGQKTRPTQVVTDQNTGKQTLIYSDTGDPVKELVGETKPTATELVKDDNTGEQKLIEKETGKVIQQIVPPRQPGQKISEDDDKLFQINKERVDKGQPPMGMEDYLKNIKRTGVSVNVSPSGATFPDPPAGYAYLRNQDPNNTVKTDTEGKPQMYKIEGGKPAEVEADKAKKEASAKVQSTFAASNVGSAVKGLLDNIDKPGVTGPGSKLVRSATGWIGGLPPDVADEYLRTIKSNVTIDTLRQMRQSSPTGGALGNVSDFEDKMLASVIGPLSTELGSADLKRGVTRVQAAMELLANDNFNKDPAKFQAALNTRMDELYSQTKPAGRKIEMVKPPNQ
jgi:hypothetical protein